MDERWQEIERIYHAAREMDGTARAEYLAQACAGDPALRERVEFLLTQADQAGSFLETPAIKVAAENLVKEQRMSDQQGPSFESGTMIAHYRLTGKIGEGGMGEVYRARDTKLQRDVALKILPQSMAQDAQRMARFEREAQVLASLNHPNIASIHGLEESNGIHALVMELVEGETLAEKIVEEGSALPREREALSYQDALPIARQIAEALEYAHEHGVIHRDLKPANVKITPEGTVKVLDFGLAKVLNPQDSSARLDPGSLLTLTTLAAQPGMIMGTAAYMSPEQAKGLKVDRRCDIWAFGCVLFEMLSGRKAFEGETISDVLAAVIRAEPDWTAIPETTPPSIQKLVRRCLVKDPKQRLRDIGEARLAIEEMLSSFPSSPAPFLQGEGGPAGRGRVRVSARRGTIPWALAGICIMAAILVYWLVQQLPRGSVSDFFRRSPPQAAQTPAIHSLVVLPLENLSGDTKQEYFADGMTEELITELSKISALRVISRTSAMAYKGSKERLPQIARELDVDGVVEGSVERFGNRVRITANLLYAPTERHLWAETYDRNLGDVLALHSEVARAIARQIKIAVTPDEQQRLAGTRTVNPEAFEACLRGRYLLSRRTGEDTRKSVGYFDQAVKIDPKYAPAYAGIADSNWQLVYYGPVPPATAYPKAKAAALKAVTLDESLAEGHTSLAEVLLSFEWDWPAAEKEFRRAIALNPGYATAHFRYAWFLTYVGRYDEALAEMKRAQKLDPLSPIINTNVGSTLFFRGDYDLAINQWRSTLELDANFSPLRLWLGLGYMAKGLREDGLRELELAAKLSNGNPSVMADLACGYAQSGQTAEARGILAILHKKAKEGYVSPYRIAAVHAALGEKDQAIEYLERAYREHDYGMLFLLLERKMFFSSLGSDPRLQDLLRRMKFPQESAAATD
jgi:eukaryotic-like serine/threonine-protein kinase